MIRLARAAFKLHCYVIDTKSVMQLVLNIS